jgi:flagellar motor switch protein FliM
MAQDFLSQDEVDALLKGVTGEADEPEQAEEGGGIRPYDLGRQERIVRGRMPTLELINERFARYLRIGLFNYMHRTTEISLGPIRVQKYSEFVRNLVVPTNLNLVHFKPLRGTGWSCSTRTWCSSWWTTCSAATGASTPASRGATSRPPSSASSRACSR